MRTKNKKIHAAKSPWQPSKTAPKNKPFIADIGAPYPVVAMWHKIDEKYIYADIRIDLFEGQWDDCYFENEHTEKCELVAWMPLPEPTHSQKSKADSSYPKCDLCAVEFNKTTISDCHHFSGILNGDYNNHLHICSQCCDKHDICTTFNFDKLSSKTRR